MGEDDYRLLFGKLVRIERLVLFICEIICVGLALYAANAAERFLAPHIGSTLADVAAFFVFFIGGGMLRHYAIYRSDD